MGDRARYFSNSCRVSCVVQSLDISLKVASEEVTCLRFERRKVTTEKIDLQEKEKKQKDLGSCGWAQRKHPRAERAGEGFQRIHRRENRLSKGSQVVRKGKFPALGN